MPIPQIKISPNGPLFSRLSHGVWRLKEWDMSGKDIANFIEKLLELGITTIDNANIYGLYTCEDLLGKGLAEAPELRDKLHIVTKSCIIIPSDARPKANVHHYDTSEKEILRSAEDSLRLMRLEYIDVLLVHRHDPLMNADEIASAFTKLRESGKVKHFGVSNFKPWQFDLLQSRLDFELVTNQVEISPLEFEVMHDGTLDQCQQKRISPMAWSPFAGGRLFTENSAQATRVRKELEKIGDELGGARVDQVALAWLLAHPSNIVPIVGSGKLERVKSAAEAMSLKLDRQQWFRIWIASKGHGVP